MAAKQGTEHAEYTSSSSSTSSPAVHHRDDISQETLEPTFIGKDVDYQPTDGIHTEKFRHPQQESGPCIDHEVTEAEGRPLGEELWWSRVRKVMKEPFSEFFGVFIMILFGDGVVAQVVLSKGEKGSYQSISWGWG